MGRENLEDYNADFLCMLESWEAAPDFVAPDRAQNAQNIDIAGILGWTLLVENGKRTRTNDTR